MPRKKKYKAKHEGVRKYVPKEFQQLADRAVDHVGNIIDKTGPRDIIYILAFISATALAYIAITGGVGDFINDFMRKLFPPLIPIPEEEPFDWSTVDWQALMMSLAVAYMVLKIDVSDVSSAITKLSGAALTGLGGIVPVAP